MYGGEIKLLVFVLRLDILWSVLIWDYTNSQQQRRYFQSIILWSGNPSTKKSIWSGLISNSLFQYEFNRITTFKYIQHFITVHHPYDVCTFFCFLAIQIIGDNIVTLTINSVIMIIISIRNYKGTELIPTMLWIKFRDIGTFYTILGIFNVVEKILFLFLFVYSFLAEISFFKKTKKKQITNNMFSLMIVKHVLHCSPLITIYTSNYCTHTGFFNDVIGVFKAYVF